MPGAPTPRTTSHSVWPSATVPDVEGSGGAPAALLVRALASADPAGGAIPGHSPSALTRSSAVIGLFGVSGGVSIETLLMNNLPERENHCASFDRRSDENMSDAPAQPARAGANSSNASRRFGWEFLSRTIN